MLFNEIYGNYYRVISIILKKVIEDDFGDLTNEKIDQIIREEAFGDSYLLLPDSLYPGEWNLLSKEKDTPIKSPPTMPITNLEKRWLKALLQDPRIKLFSPEIDGLEDVEALYDNDVFVYFDRYLDGDPYDSKIYQEHFKSILRAFKEKRRLKITYTSLNGKLHIRKCIPWKLEYSAKDDKFRIVAFDKERVLNVNIARITECELEEEYMEEDISPPNDEKKKLTLRIYDQRNALERVLLHFSHLKKETAKIDDELYQMKLYYDTNDEAEILIRILSFGPMIEVLKPKSIRNKIRKRLESQKNLQG